MGDFKLGGTTDYNLFVKSNAPTIQFTSSSGNQGTQNINLISVGSNNTPNINTLPLSTTWQNLTSGNNFSIENNNSFHLNASVTGNDFKSHFFRAGTYKFQIDLNAKSLDNSVNATQTIDYTLEVLPLSEITVPGGTDIVNFEFNTAEHYQNGQSKLANNQLTLSNNQPYELYLKAEFPTFQKNGAQSSVPASILNVGVEGGASPVTLSTTPQKLIDHGSPVLDYPLSLRYTIPEEASQTLVGKDTGTYNIKIIYSFTAL